MGRIGLGLGVTADAGGATGPGIVTSASSVPESATIGTTVAVLSVANGTGTWTFSEIADPDNKFTVSGSNLNTSAALDYEAATSHTVTVQATNGSTTINRVITINVSNVLEITLAALSLSAATLAENSAAGVVVGSIVGASSGSTVTLIDDASGRFAKSGNNIVAGLVSTDYETATTHNITLRETNADATNTPRDTVIAITVTDVVEAGPDTTPDAFSFTDATSQARSSTITSNTLTVAGINTATAISVTGGEYQVNGGAWTTSAGTVVNGDTFAVRHTSSASFSTATNTVLTIGGVSDTFTSTTLAQDTTPNAFSFTDATSQARSSTITSNTLTVAGINSPATISITGGEYQINSGAWVTASGTISNGDTFAVRHTSSSSFSTAVNTVLTIGGVSDTFTSTTLAQDTTPDAFTFTDVTGAAVSTVYESNTITVSGINDNATISVTGGEYSKNGGTYTATSGTVANGDTVKVRGTSSASLSTAVNVVLTIGGVSDTYTVTTTASAGDEAETTAYLAAMTSQPDATRKGHINTLIKGLKDDGVWSKLEGLYLLAAHDAQAARLNIKNPSGTTATFVNSPTFTTDLGVTGDASSAYVNTNLLDATGQCVQDSMSVFGYVNSAGGTNPTTILWWNSNNTRIVVTAAGYRSRAATGYGSNTTVLGFHAGNRSGASAAQAYYNGSSHGSGSVASAAPSALSLHSHKSSSGTFSNNRMAAIGGGGSLTAGEHSALYSRLLTYLTALGAN